jgi:hypothetical protein
MIKGRLFRFLGFIEAGAARSGKVAFNAPVLIPGRRLAGALAISSALLLGAACGGDEAPSDTPRPAWCLPGPPSVEVGTGSAAFVPVEPGGSVPIISGPQGGTHVWISGRTRGLGPSGLVEYGVSDAESGELLTWMGLRQIVPLDDGEDGGEIHGLSAFLSEKDPALNAGRKALVWLIVTDDCSADIRDEVEATLAYSTQ